MEDGIKQLVSGGIEALTFRLGQEEYGIDILKVQEIRSYEGVTRIANTPDYIKGVIKLRGVIVPIVDMRIRFHLNILTYGGSTVVIILNIGQRVTGMVVDSVSDVIALNPDQIRPPPVVNLGVDTSYQVGLGIIDQRVLILVDIERLMSDPELGALETMTASAATNKGTLYEVI